VTLTDDDFDALGDILYEISKAIDGIGGNHSFGSQELTLHGHYIIEVGAGPVCIYESFRVGPPAYLKGEYVGSYNYRPTMAIHLSDPDFFNKIRSEIARIMKEKNDGSSSRTER
jgi:hypothetical protein